jgi:hypothetical protein
MTGRAPNKFSCDFETSLIYAVIETYPDIQILACFFHFSQNVKKHVSEVGYSGLNMRK